MCIRARALVVSMACIAVVSPTTVIRGQESMPSPPNTSSGGMSSTVRPEADMAATQAASKPGAAPTPDFLDQEELTGDWNGRRTRWTDKGFELKSSLTQFYQGVSSGGTGTSSEYNGTAQAELKFDLGKLAGWQFWSAEIKAETRFGGPLVTSTGTISPVNTAAI